MASTAIFSYDDLDDFDWVEALEEIDDANRANRAAAIPSNLVHQDLRNDDDDNDIDDDDDDDDAAAAERVQINPETAKTSVYPGSWSTLKPQGGTCKRMKSQCPSTDRISTLPQSIIENILTLMPIRDALKTSILSKKWRYCWTGMPKLEFREDLPLHCGQLQKYKFVNAIFHVLLLHKGPLLEFRLVVGEADLKKEFDQIIPYLSRSNNVKNFVLASECQEIYRLPTSFFSWQGLERLALDSCDLEPPLKFNGLSKLKRIWFSNVKVSAYTLECILSGCPLLEKLVLIDYEEDLVGDNNFTCAKLITCVPLIKAFQLSNKYIKYLSRGGVSQKLLTSLVHLKTLYLDLCFVEQDEISCALCLIRSSPNLEEIVFVMYDNEKLPVRKTSINSLDPEDYSDLKLDHLLKLEIHMFSNLFLEMEFVKLIMAKSPVLKKARIVLDDNVSADEEMGILRELILLLFPRASPSAKLTVERSENS